MGKESGRPGVGRYAAGRGGGYIYSIVDKWKDMGLEAKNQAGLLGSQEGECRPAGLSKRKGKKKKKKNDSY